MAGTTTDVDPPVELLATRRSRRSTAGNRMEAAMAEMELDEFKDAEDDADFTNDKDEEDIFDADFASTDDEAAAQDDDAGEAAAREEDKRAQKAKRSALEKATSLAHARNKATFEPSSPPKKTRRRVALGGAVNAATGEAIAERPTAHRQSLRAHTVLNTSLTETRLKRSLAAKAAQTPKKPRAQGRVVTQAELLARALDAEEGNIVEHRDYLRVEEEKRRRARVVRPAVQGPLVRWVSRVEEVKVVVPPPPPPPPPSYGYGYTPAGSSGGYVFPAFQQPAASTSTAPYIPSTSTFPSTAYRRSPAVGYAPYTATPPAPTTRTEKVARNYVVHEETQYPDLPPSASSNTAGRASNPSIPAARSSTTTRTQPAPPKPTWGATMTALFGSHVDWEEVKVYAGKSRPMARPIPTCPLTGLPAHYRDPRTGVPFANLSAFQTLTRVLNHEYVWSPELGAYVRQEAPVNKAVTAPKSDIGAVVPQSDVPMEE
ncbi:YL1 nuclear protein-domain-containing protein [Mycena maculata]|uniref:YL1 nuclear protein-domain-containing protein n=1 Tax=Mycena maculata TaxID=230809 RepID=A0AAD7HS37_9AGAR|nr:YL1 nuclear protein-domain-containing protein [Mycena maculata]